MRGAGILAIDDFMVILRITGIGRFQIPFGLVFKKSGRLKLMLPGHPAKEKEHDEWLTVVRESGDFKCEQQVIPVFVKPHPPFGIYRNRSNISG